MSQVQQVIWTKEKIIDLLERNDQAVGKAVVAIYKRQTAFEQDCHATTVHNGVGFNGPDAEILTKFAVWWQDKGFFTPKMMSLARRKIKKYSRQLIEIAHETQTAARPVEVRLNSAALHHDQIEGNKFGEWEAAQELRANNLAMGREVRNSW